VSGTPVEEHRKLSSEYKVSFCLIVTSDAVIRGERPDKITPLVDALVKESGNKLVNTAVVPNDLRKIRDKVKEFSRKCDIVVVTGGTGLGDKDVSVDAVSSECIKEMPGFGELFRYLTFKKHGTAALMSRAMACRVNYSLVFVTPGSPDAVEMALRDLIIPECKHMVFELRR
jgi:molybdenum cofactor biosynthesis protein B